MAESHDPNAFDQPKPEDELNLGSVPVEEDAPEPEAPRRAASAQFVVDAEVGSEAALREAMDPANQSLGEALRLSFRVLQMVMVVLVVLFFASGFQTVDEGQSGVLTRWGKIVETEAQQALDPGLKFSPLPYPISEFHIFQSQNRVARVGDHFWPYLRATATGRQTLEEATDGASVNDWLIPGQSGYVITSDGDIAHARLSAQYEITQPVRFVQSLRNADADRLVEFALKRAMVHVAAELNVQEFVDLSDHVREQVQLIAQDSLDELGTGIRLTAVAVPETTVPLAIRRIFSELPQAQAEAEQAIVEANQRAREMLISTAGDQYGELNKDIDEYEEALQLGDQQRTEELITKINRQLDDGEYGGRVAQTIGQAKDYQSQIDLTLGAEAKRFASLLPVFLDQPELVVQQKWIEAYGRVLRRRDAEVWYVPAGVGNLRLDLASLHELRELRQKLNLDRKERGSMLDFYRDSGIYVPFLEDFTMQGPGRQLEVEGGRVRGLGRRNR